MAKKPAAKKSKGSWYNPFSKMTQAPAKKAKAKPKPKSKRKPIDYAARVKARPPLSQGEKPKAPKRRKEGRL